MLDSLGDGYPGRRRRTAFTTQPPGCVVSPPMVVRLLLFGDRSAVMTGPTVVSPGLSTTRLVLREWRDGDLDAVTAMLTDPKVSRYLEPTPDRAACWRRIIALQAGHWALRGFGWWVVRGRNDDAFLGYCGLWYPEGWPGVEIAWGLVRTAWGNGYAHEAAEAALEWAWANLQVSHVIALIAPQNRRSLATAARLGFRPTGGCTEVAGLWTSIYSLGRPCHGA
jgi:RimJ/RimL family protein N-acetyltransferase